MSFYPRFWSVLYALTVSISIFCFGSGQFAVDPALALSLPRYHIDPHLLALAQQRHQNCAVYFADEAKTVFALEELAFLGRSSASEYYRGHELLAYHYFVENKDLNGFYTDNVAGAELEYLPILPLSWRSSRGGCGWSSFIQMMLKMHSYLTDRDTKLLERGILVPRRFLVASSFNMRTGWGQGMPTPYRKGPAWEAMSAFTQSLTVGHYERWPECPDLLRKWWKYGVEIPYIPVSPSVSPFSFFHMDKNATPGPQQEQLMSYLSLQQSRLSSSSSSFQWPPAHPLPWLSRYPNPNPNPLYNDTQRRYLFFFSGHFDLPGPEMVCSTRNTILSLSQEREHPVDLLVVNSTRYDYNRRGLQLVIPELMKRSLFCLIVAGDSYSSSSLFSAISSGCLPVIVNDWLAFPYPWIIPYSSFTIRVAEEDWVMDPHVALNLIKGMAEDSPDMIVAMQQAMTVACRDYLSFSPVDRNSSGYKQMMSADRYLTLSEEGVTVPAWELLLLELRYEQDATTRSSSNNNRIRYENIPCARPLWCASNITAGLWRGRGIAEMTHETKERKKKKKERVVRFDLHAIRSLLSATTNVNIPSPLPTAIPTNRPSAALTITPTASPSASPTYAPSVRPSHLPAYRPSTAQPQDQVTIATASSLDNKIDWVVHTNSSNSSNSSSRRRLSSQQPQRNPVEFLLLKVDDFFEVHSLYLPPSILTDLRPHTCRHRGRLVGIYKIVFYMQCVRVLWTLNPGKFKPKDRVDFLSGNDSSSSSSQLLPSYEQEGLTREERDFLLAFHNIEQYRPKDWLPYPFPIAGQHIAHYSRHPNRSLLLEKRSKWNDRRVVQLRDLLQQ